jgi:hypothetical protein
MDQKRKEAADLARQQATASIVGGISDVVGAGVSLATGNVGGLSSLLGKKN